MTERAARRRARRGGGLSPEQIAAGLAVLVYGTALVLGGSLRAAGSSPSTSLAAVGSAGETSPRPSADPLHADIEAILEIDSRLTQARTDLRTLLANRNLRGSDVAFVMRRITQAVALGPDRASHLSADPRTKVEGAQLELLYANAARIAGQALDLAIGSDAAYRLAAQDIVDLFADLPSIDARLNIILGGGGPSLPPSTAPSESAPGSEPPGSAKPIKSAKPSATATSAPAPSPVPGEQLIDPSFEGGLTSWSLVLAGPADHATAASDAPLGATGESLRIDVAASDGSATAIAVAQTGVHLKGLARYTAQVTVRSSVDRPVQIRIVGPNEEPYAIKVADASSTPSIITMDFSAVADAPDAVFRIDIGGADPGSVWLDDASLAIHAPG